MVVDGDALAQGAIGLGQQHVLEFGLSDQKNVDQFAVAQFDVGEHPDLVDELVVQTLGFVDDQQDPLAILVGLVKEFFQGEQEFTLAGEIGGNLELGGHDPEKIERAQPRVGDVGHKRGCVEAADQSMDEGGLAHAHIPGEQQEAHILDNAILECRQGFLVLFAQPQEVRFGAQVKRFDGQTIVVKVHGCLFVC